MEQKKKKFTIRPPLERLEVYMLAADNPVGKRQLRPIFRRKRSKEILTREQVTAIKRGRRVLRQEMKERGLKRWSDFDQMATNLGLYFDRKGLLWPLILWFGKGNTALKILATATVLTTLMTVTEQLIEYITEYLTEYVTEYVVEYVPEYITEYVTEYIPEYVPDYFDRDRFTISLSHDMLKTGFELSETPDFASPMQTLFAIPVTRIPCISISQIPHNVDELENNTVKEYFTYTFYCRHINKTAEQDMTEDLSKYAVNYDWGLRIHSEGLNTTTNQDTGSTVNHAAAGANGSSDSSGTGDSGTGGSAAVAGQRKVSDAVWVMVIQDGEVIVCAKSDVGENGELIPQALPTQQVLESQRIAFRDRSIDYINTGLQKIHPGLNVDNLHDLRSLFGDQASVYEEQINAYFDVEGIQDLTRLMLRTENWRERYKIVAASDNYNYYQVVAEEFVSDKIIAERTRKGVLPWIEGRNEEYHKYTVVIWLEGDDPQCENTLMDGFIGLNFQIKAEDEDYVDTIVTPTTPSTESGGG